MSEIYLILIISAIAVGIVMFMLLKKMDIKFTLLFVGLGLMYISLLLGRPIDFPNLSKAGADWLDPISVITQQFVVTLSGAGIIILILGGYANYMQEIKASDVTVYALTKPLKYIKSPWLLIPIVFIIGNFLSLVIPSSSNLSIILLATLYPVLRKNGMSALTAAALIATSATVVPTPLGSDNVAITEELSKSLPEFANLQVTDYVFQYHALVSIPTLIVMMVLHTVWQQYMDRRNKTTLTAQVETSEDTVSGGMLYKSVYTVLPLLPIVILLVAYISNFVGESQISISVGLASFLSFLIAVACELIKNRNIEKTLKSSNSFFIGMGKAMDVVALLVSASIFVTGLKSIGLIEILQNYMENSHNSGLLLPLILLGVTALITLLSGSGLALFFSMIPLMVPLAIAANINPLMITLPMGLGGNLFRSVSPVAAVIVIIAGTIKENPFDIVKRTAIPCIGGVIFMFGLTALLYG